MLVQIRDNFSNMAVILCGRFSLSNYSKELELFFSTIPSTLTKKQLEDIGFKESNYSTHVWVGNTDKISHFSSQ